MADLKNADPSEASLPGPDLTAGLTEKPNVAPKVTHPSGREGYGTLMQILRGALFSFYFMTCCIM
jgi:hypothetical protein